MAVAVRSTSSVTGGTRTNTTITAPAGITNGDVLVALMTVGAASAPTVTPPSGFTEVTTTGWPLTIDKSDPWQMRVRFFWKVASGESGNYTFTHSSAYTEAIMYAASGANTTTPVSPNPTSASGDSTTATATGLTTPVDSSLVIWVGSVWNNIGPTTPPTGTTPTFTEYFDGGSGGIFYSAAGVMTTAGATGNKAVSNVGGSYWVAGLISIQAATGGGGTAALPRRALDGPFVGAFRGSVR